MEASQQETQCPTCGKRAWEALSQEISVCPCGRPRLRTGRYQVPSFEPPSHGTHGKGNKVYAQPKQAGINGIDCSEEYRLLV